MFPVAVDAGTSRVLSSMVHGLNAGRGKHTPVTGTVQGDGHNVCIAAARLHQQRGGDTCQLLQPVHVYRPFVKLSIGAQKSQACGMAHRRQQACSACIKF
jgi:hypothetical protein